MRVFKDKKNKKAGFSLILAIFALNSASFASLAA